MSAAAFALLDAQQHTRAVDIGHLQRQHFRGPEPSTVGDAERGLVLGAGSRVEEAGNLLLGQHRGQLPGLLDAEQGLEKIVPVERDAEKEPQRGHRRVHTGRAERALHKMKTVEPQIFRRCCCRRPSDEGRKVLDAPDVVLLRLLSEMPRSHVADRALAKRADTHTQLLL